MNARIRKSAPFTRDGQSVLLLHLPPGAPGERWRWRWSHVVDVQDQWYSYALALERLNIMGKNFGITLDGRNTILELEDGTIIPVSMLL